MARVEGEITIARPVEVVTLELEPVRWEQRIWSGLKRHLEAAPPR